MKGDKHYIVANNGAPLAPTVRGLVEGANARTRHVVTGIQWTICEKLGHRNPDMVTELKINEVALTSSMKSIIAYITERVDAVLLGPASALFPRPSEMKPSVFAVERGDNRDRCTRAHRLA